MNYDSLSNTELLNRWRTGDESALDYVLRRHIRWIRSKVRNRLGVALRRKVESTDVIQDAILRFLRDGVQFNLDNSAAFRAIVARIVENTIRDTSEFFHAQRRDMRREAELRDPVPVIDLDAKSADENGVEARLDQADKLSYLRLALELMRPLDRALVVRRARLGRSFPEIARELRISEGAARTRYFRAATRLQQVVRRLRQREIVRLVDELEAEENDS